jgi:hypothetical protein
MKIACLGWGPLVWDPQELPIDAWRRDGPPMQLEFARLSDEGWITLVLVPLAERAQCLWAPMRVETLADARQALAQREGIAPDAIERDVGYWTPDTETDFLHADVVGAWATQKKLDAVVWNALPPRQLSTPEHAVTALRSLSGETLRRAEETIRHTHRQIDTRYRRRIEAELSWTPIGFV